jgi:hypothetical protein
VTDRLLTAQEVAEWLGCAPVFALAALPGGDFDPCHE